MSLSRRAVLTGALGVLGAAGCSRLAARPGTSSRAPYTSAAEEVSGPFSWRRAAGQTIEVVLPTHPASRALVAGFPTFTELTGVEVRARVLPDARYFDDVTRSLVAGAGDVDVFLTGPSTVWQYAPPGWVEDLAPWLANPSATSAEYDVDDVLESMRTAVQWDLVNGHPVGTGGQWAMPLAWEPVGLAYRADVFAELGLAPPTTLAELEDTARRCTQHLATRVDGGYGLSVRGARSWTTLEGAFISQFVREGGQDFDETAGGQLVPQVHSGTSVDFHTRWTRMVRDCGPTRWTEQTSQGCASHLRTGRAAMSYDVAGGALPELLAAGAPAGALAWAPGPAGASGDLSSSLWVWSAAVSSRSPAKLAAWLFVQWATGAEHARAAASAGVVEPVRRSVLAAPTARAVSDRLPGYREAVDAVLSASRVAFTPQPYFFDAATGWVDALHEMHSGRDPENALLDLSEQFRRRR